MRTHTLSFKNADRFVKAADLVVFVKPIRSKLFRIFRLPEDTPERLKELSEVLTTVCTRHRDGVWYFKNDDDIFIVTDTLDLMGFSPILVKLDTSKTECN